MRKNILILGHNDATQFIDIYNQYTSLFDKDQYEVTVAYLTGGSDNLVKERSTADHVIFLDLPKKSIRGLKFSAIKKVYELCKEKNFQVVICHRYKPTYIILWIAQLLSIPAAIFVMHEMETMTALSRQLIIATLSKKNMLFAGVSDAVREDMRKSLWGIPKERVITLYNVIDIDETVPQLFTREEARQILNLPTDAFVFGNIARLVPNKDQANLIKAFAQIKSQCSKAKLIIMGSGELEQTLKEQVNSLNLVNDIIFTGFLSQAFRYMQAFDGFVLSSIQEAFGRVLLEAMIAKLPIIATKVNGIPEVMGNVGMLVSPGDVLALAHEMQQLYNISTQEKIKKGEQAYQHVNNHFSIPFFREQFWQLPLIQSIKG